MATSQILLYVQALPVMPQILARRPVSFPSLEAAIGWAVSTGTSSPACIVWASLSTDGARGGLSCCQCGPAQTCCTREASI